MKLSKSQRNYVYPSDAFGPADPIHTDHDTTSISCVIRWSSEWQEWQVFTSYQPDNKYHTDHADDALTTARAMLREGIRIRTAQHANKEATK